MYNKEEILKISAKYLIYFVITVILYILGATPGFMEFNSVKPCFVVPFCIALALNEEDFKTIIIYVAGGLLIDVSAGKVAGFFTIPLLLCCIACMIGVKFVFKSDLKSEIAFSFITMFILLNHSFVFGYLIYGFGGLLTFFAKHVIVQSAYSALFGIPMYYLVQRITGIRLLHIDARWKA